MSGMFISAQNGVCVCEKGSCSSPTVVLLGQIIITRIIYVESFSSSISIGRELLGWVALLSVCCAVPPGSLRQLSGVPALYPVS